jgi:dolichol kinase
LKHSSGILTKKSFLAKALFISSIMVLTLGDSFSKIFGPLGRIKTTLNPEKKIEGTIVGIIAGTIGAMWFVAPQQAFFGTLIAMIGELIDFQYVQMNDNLLVPLVAGMFMKLFAGI